MEDKKTNEVNFNKVTQWLEEYHFSLQNVQKISDSKSDLKFYCEVRPYPSRLDFFKIIISDKFRDAILLQSNIQFDEMFTKSLDMTRWRERQQIFINFRKVIYPLGINLESNKQIGGIILHKTVFYASLNNKQYFFDSIYNMINAMQLVNAVFDEFRNSLFPEGE